MNKRFLFFLLFMMGAVAFSQTFVSTTPSTKNVLIEEFTGVGCQYCPDGHRIVNQIMASNPNRVFGINIHAGSYAANTYTTTDGEAIRANWNVTSFPAGMINRHTFSGSSPVLNRGNFSSCANTIINQPSCANIAARCTIDCATRLMTVDVELFYTDSSVADTNYISVALLQDNILGRQSGASYNPTQIIDGQYNHQHMFRAFINGSTWGDTVYTTDSGSFVSRTYTYTLPANISNVPVIIKDLELIAFVSESKADVITACKASITYTNASVLISKMEKYERYTCDMDFYTTLSLFNLTSDTIHSVEFRYGTTLSSASSYTRTGLNIAYLEGDTVRLPAITGNFNSGADYTGYAKIVGINGQPVDGDSLTCMLNKLYKDASGDSLTFTLTTDNYGSETSWKFKNHIGRVIASGGPYSNSSQTYTIKLPVPSDGCYRLELYDSQGDGINGGYGSGSFRISDNNNTLLTHNGRFNDKVIVFLSCSRGADIQSPVAADFTVYPNPVKYTLHIESEENIDKAEIFDMQGKMVVTDENANEINVSALPQGSYIVRITTEKGVSTRTFVKE